MEVTKVQDNSGLSLAEVNVALKDGIDIAVGPCSVRVPAQAVADARAGWSALRSAASSSSVGFPSASTLSAPGAPRFRAG